MKAAKTKQAPKAPAPQAAPPPPLWARALPWAVAAATALAYLPVLRNRWAWDDDINILQNYSYRGLAWKNLQWIFAGSFGNLGNYEPVTWLSMALIHQVFGMDPKGYHLAGLLLHAGAAAAFYGLGLKLLRLALPDAEERSPGALRCSAAFAALFFSLHPLRVEAAGWVSGQHHVMAALFFMAGLDAYLRRTALAPGAAGRAGWTAWSVAAYVLSMLCMPIGMGLPLVLLVVDAYPLGRLRWDEKEGRLRRAWELLWEKLPWALGGGAFVVVAFLARSTRGAMTSLEEYGAAPRLAQALFGLAFYLYKTLVPTKLMALYELKADISLFDGKILLSAAAVAALVGALAAARRRWPAAPAAGLFYLIILFPVLGFSQSGHQIAADRYTYISCMGWSLLAGGALLAWLRQAAGPAYAAAVVLPLLWLGGLGGLTWKQVQVWRDGEALWRHAIAVDPKMAGAHSNLGMALADKQRYDEAIEAYNQELLVSPKSSFAENNLGNAYAMKGGAKSLEESLPHFQRALEYQPNYAQGHVNYGNALDDLGRRAEALAEYDKALALSPKSLAAHYNKAVALMKMGLYKESVQEFETVAAVNPDYEHVETELPRARELLAGRGGGPTAEAENAQGEALARAGRIAESRPHFELAVRLDPGLASAWNNLGNVLLSMGDGKSAIERYRRALQLKEVPSYRNNLGAALARSGRIDEAVAEFRAALKTDPDQENALVNLADALTALGRRDEALRELEAALARRPGSAHLQQALRKTKG